MLSPSIFKVSSRLHFDRWDGYRAYSRIIDSIRSKMRHDGGLSVSSCIVSDFGFGSSALDGMVWSDIDDRIIEDF